jgi:hypothetical protein
MTFSCGGNAADDDDDAGAADGGTCSAESDSAFCQRLGKNCGMVSAVDLCEETRTVDCGACSGQQACGAGGVENVCGDPGQCQPETDAEMCTRLAAECGGVVGTDNCGVARTPVCGICAEPEMCGGDGVANLCGTDYPYRDVWNMKGIQPDDWPRDDLQANGIGGVPANLVWAQWEPSVDAAPCGSGRFEYDNRCYVIRTSDDDMVRDWTNRGVLVTAILFGTPAWASEDRAPYCSEDAWGNGYFWAPDDDKVVDFGRYVGMIADRYDGTKGHGRIADFVVLNEVNVGVWFDVGRKHPDFDQQLWIDTYADNYIAAYDRIKAEQPSARVLMSFDHHYDERHNLPFDAGLARLSSQSIIRGVAARADDREWQVAFHPYSNIPWPAFDARDLDVYGKSTYGTVGTMVGWLRAEFPDRPHAWQVQLTENGVASGPNHSVNGDDVAARMQTHKLKVCEALRNVLATPWTDNHIYHRMVDHSMESGFLVGLAWGVMDPKPAWNAYRLANLPGSLDCGYEDLPYTRLTQGFVGAGLLDLGKAYRTSSRSLPDDFELVSGSGWRLLRDWQPGTRMLFECATGEDLTMITADASCAGTVPMGPVGHVWIEPDAGLVPLYRCKLVDDFSNTHFVHDAPGCGGSTMEEFLGYALPPEG